MRWIHSFWAAIRRWILHISILIFLLFSPFFGVETAAGPAGLRSQVSRAGRLTLTWGDGKPGSGRTSLLATLVDEAGEATVLEIEPQSFGNIYGMNRRRVVAMGRWEEVPGLEKQVLQVSSLQMDEKSYPFASLSDASASALSGPQPWVNVLCKFADVAAEPQSLSYFNGLLGEEAPGLGHYWREASYDQINILGSDSFGWYTLPKTAPQRQTETSSSQISSASISCSTPNWTVPPGGAAAMPRSMGRSASGIRPGNLPGGMASRPLSPTKWATALACRTPLATIASHTIINGT
jgi:hypothetical protein